MINKRDYYLKRKYGITEEDYAWLLQKQAGVCAVCKQRPDESKGRYVVDHDHSTGEIRGILCNYCNHRKVGNWRKGNIGVLKSVLSYLDRDYTGWFVPVRGRKCGKKRKKRSRVLRQELS